jgi:DNA-binding CsgD family transcriptional regulator/ligand-binding sensor domain-containing protein
MFLKKRLPWFLLFLILFWRGQSAVNAIGTYIPEVRNFTREIYGASGQNWSVAQDKKGITYVANSFGLLEFDGATWNLHASPGGNIIRAVAADSSGRIYTSGYRELGFWERDVYGVLSYTSLKEKAETYFTPNVEFWNIYFWRGKVIFQSFMQILIYENERIQNLNLSHFSNSFYLMDGKMLINSMDSGIYELTGSGEKPFLTGSFFTGKIVRFVLPAGNNRYLLGTASHGIFVIDENGTVSPWNTAENEYFVKNQINRGCILSSGNLLVGTILDGVSLLDLNGKLIWRINMQNGLQNNTVLGMYEDKENNIWLALDRGIDLITTHYFQGIKWHPVKGIGAVYSATQTDGKLFLGTNQGLFHKPLQSVADSFKLVPGTQGQVWDLRVIGNRLIVGHNSGTFLVANGKADKISEVAGAFSLAQDPGDNETFWQCTYSNIVKYRLVDGVLTRSKVYYTFNDLIRYIEIDHLGNFFAGHMHRGIFRLRLNNSGDSLLIKDYYGQNSALGKDDHLHVFKIDNRVVFTTGEKLFTFDDLRDTIIPFDLMNNQLGEYARVNRIIPVTSHLYWFITKTRIGLIDIYGLNIKIIREFPYEVFAGQMIRDYENIVPVNESEAIICLANGYAYLYASASQSDSSLLKKVPVLQSVNLADNNGMQIPLPVNLKFLKIPHHQNNLRLIFSFPHYSTDRFAFRWIMEGLTPTWSDDSYSPELSFERLPKGEYLLKVLAVDKWGQTSRIYYLPVTVLPPWYWSIPAKIFFMLISVALLVLFRTTIVRKTQKKEQHKQEEKEKELITLKNEKLQSEIEFKSRELANSTMVIIKKNEFLLDLKNTLVMQKSKLGERFPEKYYTYLMKKIEENLESHDEWKVFETNFEQAHEEFMKKLKTTFPELTPKDIRLCAFLRMNLSSKEIAPLLGISVRGVENHRYRLRQKMNLEHDTNLIETILNF